MNLGNINVNSQSSIRIEGSKILYFDPFQMNEKAEDADIIFITHEHSDHFDPRSIELVRKEETVIIAPASMEEIMGQFKNCDVLFLAPGQREELGEVRVHAVPAYNLHKPYHTKEREWLGYVVNMDDIKYYIAGDTDVNEDVERIRCDVALIPIGGQFTMDKRQAASFILNMKPIAAIPTHYGSIVGTPNDGVDFKELVQQVDRNIQVEIKH